MKKRILSLLCVLCLMLTMLPTSAFAAGYDAPTLSIEASYDSASSKVTAKVILGACSDLGALDFHMQKHSSTCVTCPRSVSPTCFVRW